MDVWKYFGVVAQQDIILSFSEKRGSVLLLVMTCV